MKRAAPWTIAWALVACAAVVSVARAQTPGADGGVPPQEQEAAEEQEPAEGEPSGPGAQGAEEPEEGADAPVAEEAAEERDSADPGPEDELEGDEAAEGLDTTDATRDPDALTRSPAAQPIRYFLERVEVTGNDVTKSYVVRRFVPIEPGEVLDVDDPAIETIRWRLLGTGWFSDVRLRLRRGEQRGWVVLVIDVEERNTLVIQQVALGISQGVASTGDTSTDPLPWAGLTVAETNLLGLGMGLSLTGLASKRQQGIRARFTDPVFLGSDYLFSVSGLFANGMEFFGQDPLVAIRCPEPDPGEEPEECPPEVEAKNAVVLYRRAALSFGTGHDLGASAYYTLDWQGELVDVRVRPDAASELEGEEVRPLDFSIEPDLSIVSSIQLGLVFDRRDDPALPSRGTHVQFRGVAASALLGSDYNFLRLEVLGRQWVPLPWGGHHLRFGIYAGTIFGDAPFFYQFHVADLTDLIPSRVLDMNIDNRAPPNLLGTSIAEMRAEEVAGRVDVEYGLPLYRGDGSFRALNAYFGVGLYALADRDDLRVAIPGYEGLSAIPVDLTFDLGVRADTSVGVFQLGFSSLLGFITP